MLNTSSSPPSHITTPSAPPTYNFAPAPTRAACEEVFRVRNGVEAEEVDQRRGLLGVAAEFGQNFCDVAVSGGCHGLSSVSYAIQGVSSKSVALDCTTSNRRGKTGKYEETRRGHEAEIYLYDALPDAAGEAVVAT